MGIHNRRAVYVDPQSKGGLLTGRVMNAICDDGGMTPRWGHSGTEGGRTCVTYFAEEGVFFLRPPHVRDFVKEGYFFVARYEVWGSKSPYNPRNIRGCDAE